MPDSTFLTPHQAAASMTAAAWAAAIANLLVAFVAAFQESLRRWRHHPQLDLQLHPGRPDCQRIDIPVMPGGDASAFYLRLRVHNRGNLTAEHVEVYLGELLEFRDNAYRPCAWFLPMALTWAHTGLPFSDYISPDTYKHCDLGRISDPAARHPHFPDDDLQAGVGRPILHLFLQVHPVNGRDNLLPGAYRLVVTVAAKDMPSSRWHLALTVPEQWIADEQVMIRERLRLALTKVQ